MWFALGLVAMASITYVSDNLGVKQYWVSLWDVEEPASPYVDPLLSQYLGDSFLSPVATLGLFSEDVCTIDWSW